MTEPGTVGAGIRRDPAFRLLAAVARRVADPEAAADAIAAGVDWDRFTALAIGHGIPVPAYRGLAGLAGVPRLPSLAAAARATALRSLHHVRETLEVVRALRMAGIPALVLKGAVEGVATWKEPACRRAGDIDLFVAPEDASRAAQVIQDQGGEGIIPELAAGLGAWWLLPGEMPFRMPSGFIVEIHWRFAFPPALFALPVAALARCAVFVAVAGEALPTLPFPERFLYLCAHGGGHGWVRLGWLCDVAEILRQAGPADGAAVAVLAGRTGLIRALAVAGLLASSLLDAPLPAWLPPADGTARRLAARWSVALLGIPDGFARRGYRPPATKLMTDLALCRGWKNKASILAAPLYPGRIDLAAPGAAGLPPGRIALRRLGRLLRHGPRTPLEEQPLAKTVAGEPA